MVNSTGEGGLWVWEEVLSLRSRSTMPATRLVVIVLEYNEEGETDG